MAASTDAQWAKWQFYKGDPKVGLKWKCCAAKPARGTELENMALRSALRQKHHELEEKQARAAEEEQKQARKKAKTGAASAAAPELKLELLEFSQEEYDELKLVGLRADSFIVLGGDKYFQPADQTWNHPVSRRSMLRECLFQMPPIEWNSIGAFQDVTL